MQPSVIALRALYWLLMAVFLLLIIGNSISGWGTVLYTLAVVAVILWERLLVRHRAGQRAAR